MSRDGTWQDLPSRFLVPGDVVLVKLANIGPADMKAIVSRLVSIEEMAGMDILCCAHEATQLLGTLVAVHGWFIEPIDWGYALLVWGYALAWFVVNNIAKVWTHRAMQRGTRWYARHLSRVQGRQRKPGIRPRIGTS